MLAEKEYPAVNATSKQREGKGLSKQSWAIIPKIREVDDALRSDGALRQRTREVHPEVCFFHLAGGRPMVSRKSTPEGILERLNVLRQPFKDLVEFALNDRRKLGCAYDDLIDAFAALWTARRIAAGTAVRIPAEPDYDSCGLPMEMWA